jgi:hypothetical protein
MVFRIERKFFASEPFQVRDAGSAKGASCGGCLFFAQVSPVADDSQFGRSIIGTSVRLIESEILADRADESGSPFQPSRRSLGDQLALVNGVAGKSPNGRPFLLDHEHSPQEIADEYHGTDLVRWGFHGVNSVHGWLSGCSGLDGFGLCVGMLNRPSFAASEIAWCNAISMTAFRIACAHATDSACLRRAARLMIRKGQEIRPAVSHHISAPRRHLRTRALTGDLPGPGASRAPRSGHPRHQPSGPAPQGWGHRRRFAGRPGAPPEASVPSPLHSPSQLGADQRVSALARGPPQRILRRTPSITITPGEDATLAARAAQLGHQGGQPLAHRSVPVRAWKKRGTYGGAGSVSQKIGIRPSTGTRGR